MMNPKQKNPFITVALIRKPLGFDGFFLVSPQIDRASDLKKLSPLYISDLNRFIIQVTLKTLKEESNGIQIQFTGIKDRDQAKKYCGSFLVIPEKFREKIPFRPENWPYLRPSVQEVKLGFLGVVSAIQFTPSYPLLILDGPSGSVTVPMAKNSVRNLDAGKNLIEIELSDEIRSLIC